MTADDISMQLGNRLYTTLLLGVVSGIVIYSAAIYRTPPCNIAYIKMRGAMVTYIPPSGTSTSLDESASETITGEIRQAGGNQDIRAIVLEIDSPGGSGVAAGEIEAALKLAHKPTVALIREMGTSAAYEAATAANIIFAAPESEVGGIGITESYVDNSAQNRQNGLTYHQLSIGKYKDMLDPNKPLMAAERTVVMANLQVGYNDFVRIVATDRHIPLARVQQLADGSEFMGQTALAYGLVDRLGNVDDVRYYLSQKLGTAAVICSLD